MNLAKIQEQSVNILKVNVNSFTNNYCKNSNSFDKTGLVATVKNVSIHKQSEGYSIEFRVSEAYCTMYMSLIIFLSVFNTVDPENFHIRFIFVF